MMTITATTPVNPRLHVRPPKRNAWAVSLCADLLAFSIGIGSCYTVRVFGEIPGCEVILIPFLPVLLAIHPDRIVRRRLLIMFALMGLWLLAQITTDIYRATEMVNWAKGDASICFFALDLAGLAVLLKQNLHRQKLFILGLALGSLLAMKIDPNVYVAGSPWKFGYASGVMLLVILISCHFYHRRQFAIVGLLLVGITGVNLLLNFRSPVLFLLITAVLILNLIPEQLLPPRGTNARIAILAALVLCAGGAASFTVSSLANSGALGPEAQLKNQKQSGSGMGLLFGGRPEIFVSSRAVFDSPILGHGSWARDMKYVDMLNDFASDHGMRPEGLEESEFQGLIPSHSHLMSAWVYAGVFGAIFWGYVFGLGVKALIRVATVLPPIAPLYVWMLVNFVFDVLFSPFGSIRRITEAFVLVMVLDVLDILPSAVTSVKSKIRSKVAPSETGRALSVNAPR